LLDHADAQHGHSLNKRNPEMATIENEQVPEVIAVQMAKDRELRREERQALTAIPAANLATAASRTTFMPQSMGEAIQLATIMARSSFVPAHCRGNDGNCLAIIMQSGRWGMDPFAVANKAYFLKEGAPPAFESQLINAVVNSSGALSGRLRIDFSGEGEKLRCTVSGFLRADPNDEKVKTQHISRITTRNSPLWKTDPEQQLGYYTTRAWARLHCPEVLLGVYTPEDFDEGIDPERARVVSAPIPRRGGAPALIKPDHDPVTGEIPDDREIAEQLDRETERAVAGETIVAAKPAPDLADFAKRLKRVEIKADFERLDDEFAAFADSLSDDDYMPLKTLVDAGREKFLGGK
jgi:hypothetical protein